MENEEQIRKKNQAGAPPFWASVALVVPLHLLISLTLFLIGLPHTKLGDGNPAVQTILIALCFPVYFLNRLADFMILPDSSYIMAWLSGSFFWAWIVWLAGRWLTRRQTA